MNTRSETYYLNQKTLPTIPTPHDCIIKKISLQDECIVFEFENDISYHDSIKAIEPKARSLIVRYHLVGEGDFSIYKWVKPKSPFFKNGAYKCLSEDFITKLADTARLEYLYHNVGYCSVITKLYSKGFVILDACADSIEFEWIY